MKIHQVLPLSQANGPGSRFVLWMQGCSRRCPGCFNPLTHDAKNGYELSVNAVTELIPVKSVYGITVSGGEPFEQPEELADLLEGVKKMGLHRLVYTGFTHDELARMAGGGREALKKQPGSSARSAIRKCLSLIDILIDGAYQKGSPANVPWAGSANQRVLELSGGRITGVHDEINNTENSGEIFIDQSGAVTVTGILDSRVFA
jgi:anaerobic ribonucleoside-triphosphate reductase activating protein